MKILKSKLKLKGKTQKKPQGITVKSTPTPSESAYSQAKKLRFRKALENTLPETHRTRIERYNKALAQSAEHFEIPKVGPG